MTAAENPVDIGLELERKTLDALKRAQDRFKAGLITNETYQELLTTVNDCVRGLVEEPIMLFIDAERDVAGWTSKAVFDEVLYNDESDAFSVVSVQPESGSLLVANISKDGGSQFIRKRIEADIDQHKQAFDAVKTIRARLIKRGYTRLL